MCLIDKNELGTCSADHPEGTGPKREYTFKLFNQKPAGEWETQMLRFNIRDPNEAWAQGISVGTVHAVYVMSITVAIVRLGSFATQKYDVRMDIGIPQNIQ